MATMTNKFRKTQMIDYLFLSLSLTSHPPGFSRQMSGGEGYKLPNKHTHKYI